MQKNGIDKIAENGKSLRELVYIYFCDQMKVGKLSAGNFINQSEICTELNISKAPLRDALIQLEIEGFVTILPRRGVLINTLTLKDIVEAYEILGTLESDAARSAYDKIKERHLKSMELINENLFRTLESGKFAEYYKLNNDFHNIFLNLSGNSLFLKIVAPIKQRLYDFPLKNYNIEWEKENLQDHERFIISIRRGNREAAANIIKYEHWSFPLHEKHIRKFYQL
jgi:DNA-binding GntR family transcriptional regulator